MLALFVATIAIAGGTLPKVDAELAAGRFGYGVVAGEREALRKQTWAQWIDKQLDYERIDDRASDVAVDAVGALTATPDALMELYPKPEVYFRGLYRMGVLPPEIAKLVEGDEGKVDASAHKDDIRAYYAAHDLRLPQELVQTVQDRYVMRALTTRRQLYEEMVDFWLDHFNVFIQKDGLPYAVVAFERDAIRPHALGRFGDLLRAVAQSPAMLDYLDNASNVRPGGPAPGQALPPGVDPAQCKAMDEKRAQRLTALRDRPTKARRSKVTTHGINENYARELLELHTMGVDGGYTQRDVTETARALTGWLVFDPRGESRCPFSGRAFFAPELHDDGDKEILGTTLHGAGSDELLAVLDLVARQPATARFIATKLARRFVSDEPSKQLIDKAAKTFIATQGDIRATLRTIAVSTEAQRAAQRGDKVKRPLDLVLSALRAVGATSDDAGPVRKWLARMGQLPYGCLTPNGYPDRAEPWVSAGALVERLNFGLTLAAGQLRGTRVDLGDLFAPDLVFGGAAKAEDLVDVVSEALVGRKLSDATRKTIIASIEESETLGDATAAKANVVAAKRERAGARTPDPRVTRVVGLILGAPEFQHR